MCLNVLANHLEQFILNDSHVSYGMLLCHKQKDLDPAAKDYSYIEYLQKSIRQLLNVPDSIQKDGVLRLNNSLVKFHESTRDYFSTSLRQVNNLIQIVKPNFELMEPKWELYKISISFQKIRKYNNLIYSGINLLP